MLRLHICLLGHFLIHLVILPLFCQHKLELKQLKIKRKNLLIYFSNIYIYLISILKLIRIKEITRDDLYYLNLICHFEKLKMTFENEILMNYNKKNIINLEFRLQQCYNQLVAENSLHPEHI